MDIIPTELDINIERLAKWIKKAKRVLIFAGSGISTESGIPTFYGNEGLHNYIKENQEENGSDIRIDLIKQFYSEKSLPLNEIKINASHVALKKMIEKGFIHKIITVNKDGLLHKVGIPDDRVIEFHGSFTKFKCVNCGGTKRFELSDLAKEFTLYDLLNGYNSENLPFGQCEDCKIPMVSTAINFNHPFNKELIDETLDEGINCDLLIALGSSFNILPISSVINIAAVKGKTKFIIVNLDSTDLDHLSGMVLKHPSSFVLEKLLDALST
jgi:NAD-dependent deacetylase